ncbi:immunity repressor [Gordonia phage Vendetta]|uniref:Immunity repressor n=1 Tax=Gordonia phage Vendetta TaxID=1838082 RepID=A0A160DCX6_9CAUD|nr:transcriptional repressor [Gordonia phage Vendetta]ANA85586.1 immunity repressor [Gordonia phage Vendetta]
MLDQRTVKECVRDVTGRMPSREELAIAIDASVSTIDRRRDEGFSLDETLSVLDYFKLSRTAALIAFEVLDLHDVMEQLDSDGALVSTTSTAELAAEVARRLGNENGPATDIPGTSSRPSQPPGRASQVRKAMLK